MALLESFRGPAPQSEDLLKTGFFVQINLIFVQKNKINLKSKQNDLTDKLHSMR